MTLDAIDLQLALYGDDLHEVCELLLAGADPNQELPGGSTPLLEAQTYELAAALIEHGAAVEAVDRSGRTVLHHLAFADHPDRMAQLFHQLGAPLEACDGDGRTPLLMVLAELQALPEAPVALMVLGADTTVHDAQGNGALHCWAMGRAIAEVGNWLIDTGVDPNEKNKFGQTAIDLLLSHGHHNRINAVGMLMAAVSRNHLEQATVSASGPNRSRRL